MSDKFFAMIGDEIEKTVDEQTGGAMRLITLTLGSRKYNAMKQSVAEQVIAKMPETADYIEAYAVDRLDIENTIVERMQMMDTNEYENLLRPAFKDDEWVVVALGATLGFLFGELQVQIITRLAG